MFVFVLVFVSCVVYYLNYRRLRRPLYELSKRLPDVGSLPVLGHTHYFIGGAETILRNIQRLCSLVESTGEVGKIWIGPALYVVSFNPEDVQIILETCLEKDSSYKFLKAWLGNGLFVAPVDMWKVHRRLILPIFNNRLVEDFIEVFGQQGSVLVDRLQERVDGSEFDCFPYVTSCMLDIVFETAVGERMDVQHNPDTPYLRARNTVMSIINKRLFKAWLQPDALFRLTSYAKVQKDGIDLTHKFTDDTIKKKKELFKQNLLGKGRKDFLEHLLDRDLKFSDEQLRDEIDSITIAGNDTTSLVLAYALMLLGRHLDAQEQVYQEVLSIFGSTTRRPTKEDLNKMEYTERVLKEAMRLYAVVPVIARITQKEVKLSTCTLPAGVGCAVVPLALHRSKRLWGQDADSFNPDRFLPENSVGRHPYSYIPFSGGTRNCIGRHFAMLAMKSILAQIVRTFEIKSRACDRLKIEVLLFPVDGHLVSLRRRKTNP